jgi:phosphoribosylglycinamide formyltransferase-1
MEVRKIAVFASGQGTNFQAIVDAIQAGQLQVEVGLLVCDKPAAPVVQRAHEAGVEVFTFRPKEYDSREAYEAVILERLQARGIELVVLAGYMRLLTAVLTQAYYGKMINIHPSLLPAFPGLDAVGQAIRYGVKLTGVTVHYVDDGLDSGPIIAQKTVEVRADDTADSLLERIQQMEQVLLPQVIGWFQEGRVQMDERKVYIR